MTCSEAGRKGALKRSAEQRDVYRRKAMRMALSQGQNAQFEVILQRGRCG